MIGRVACYNARHLACLRYVTSLLQSGFSLGVLHDLFAASEEDRSVRDLLGFEEAGFMPSEGTQAS